MAQKSSEIPGQISTQSNTSANTEKLNSILSRIFFPEVLERQIELERAELEAMPEEEEKEIAAIYRGRGFAEAEAAAIAKQLMADPKIALETLVREELGLDPEELGSPWGASIGSFLAFAIGAFVPLLPVILLTGSPSIETAARSVRHGRLI